jgi:DNA repair exonuclease SbcCD ATPase subunit
VAYCFIFSENDQSNDEERKISEVEQRWSGLAVLLKQRKDKIDFLQEKEHLYSEINNLESILDGYQKWLEGTKSPSAGQVNIALQLEQCKTKISSVKMYEDNISKIRKQTAELSSNQVAGIDTESINADVNRFLERWGELMLRYVLVLSVSFVLCFSLSTMSTFIHSSTDRYYYIAQSCHNV